MCGIYCCVSRDKHFIHKQKKRTSLLKHRGPDNEGSWSYNEDDNYIFFGHTRLAIIDLDKKSNQPYKKGELCIIFNGEIFNYIEIRNDLKKKGVCFETNSDTEVILEAYKHYGEKCFSTFNGMWAIIIYDLQSKNLIISRDRFGIKPFYYKISKDGLIFSSEIKPIIVESEIQINHKYLNQSLNSLFYDFEKEESYLYDIKKVPPGTFSVINIKKINNLERFNFVKFWDIQDFKNIDLSSKESFIDLLNDSVRLRMRSDVPIITLLSGGLDSSSIAKLCANNTKISNSRIRTFSIISDDKSISEEPFIDIMNEDLNALSTKQIFNKSELLDSYLRTIQAQQEPFAGFSVVAQNLIFKKIQENGLKVVMSGQGGDELMLGYLKYYYKECIEKFKSRKLIDFTSLVGSAIIKGTIFNQFRMKYAFKYIGLKRYRPNFFNQSISLNLNYENTKDIQIKDYENYSIPSLNRYEDRNSMAYGIETRHPFLDHRLVEWGVGAEAERFIKNGWNKNLLRNEMNNLPSDIRFRKDKKGFEVPHDKWLKGELKNLMFDTMKNSELESLGIISDKIFLDEFTNYTKGRSTHFSSLYFSAILNAELWLKSMKK